MRTAVHGLSRMGRRRALKWALEAYWAGRSSADELLAVAGEIRTSNWRRLANAGIEFIPSNDFSLYDHVLDTAVAVGAIPNRFGHPPQGSDTGSDLARYFAMARGGEVDGSTVVPLELTKWFDTNYHHLVPELGANVAFAPNPAKAVAELTAAAGMGVSTSPVLLGPFTFVLRSSPEALEALDPLVEVYLDLLSELGTSGADWVRLDEPALVEDRTPSELAAFARAYRRLGEATAHPQLWVSTYFGHVGEAMAILRDLPVAGVGLDFCAGHENLELLARAGGFGEQTLFAGVVDGRNVWANDLIASLDLLERLDDLCGELVVSSSCSFLHVPDSLAVETALDPAVRPWLAFAQEKLDELAVLGRGLTEGRAAIDEPLEANRETLERRRRSALVADPAVRRASAQAPADPRRPTPSDARRALQRARLDLPLLPTTTIGSFPQTNEVRALRARWRKGTLPDPDYERALRAQVDRVVALQEAVGLDVLVHGEPERDDMVRYFAERLKGFVLPEEGWVQSYGSRCVRPPILFGDISRPAPITLGWTTYAQSRTSKPMKGMLTGPITMLRWSYVRDDQPHAETAAQLGLAIGEELADLQEARIGVVQVDEPGLREGLPLRMGERAEYLAWATRAFRLASHVAAPTTQVHTHMCYAELGDVLDSLEELDVDVLSFEAARSELALVGALKDAGYRGDAGPGVYDVHSPLVPSTADLDHRLRRALEALGDRLWVNPDCGLKTRREEEVTAALANMVAAARSVRSAVGAGQPNAAAGAGPRERGGP